MAAPIRRPLFALLVLALIAPGCSGPSSAGAESPRAAAAPASAAPELARFNELLADLAERLKPALVHVRVRREAPPAEKKDREEPDDPHHGPGPRRSSGSGFLIEPDGLIVTNAHVIEGAQTAQVRLHDGRKFEARVIGRDNRVDLALLRLDGATGLPTLRLGDSNRVRVGEFVMALGHPFGLEYTVSFGIVSRKGAPLVAAAPGFDFIQTDAAINPGNSGGPLVNMAGEVVGVNSMAARNGSIGFAIPSTLVGSLVPQLVAKGRIDWGWLGVAINELDDEDVERLRLRDARGVLIRSVMPGEPADQAGVRANDVVVALDGARISGPRDLQRAVSTTPVGKTVRLVLVRDGKETALDVTIGKYREPEPSR